MRVLIVTYYYTPSVSPRAVRWSAIAEYWMQQGRAVNVLCARPPGSAESEVLNGVRVHKASEGPLGTVREWLRPVSTQSGASPALREGSNVGKVPSVQSAVARAAKWMHDRTWKKLYWPDHACLWYLSAVRKAKALHNLDHYDALISVSHPFTAHLVGLALRRAMGPIRWILDVGDPFCFLTATPPNNFRLYGRLNRRVERRVFQSADAIAVTTDGARRRYEELFPEAAAKLHTVPPLFSLPPESSSRSGAPDIKRTFPRDGKVRLVFVGTLYRDIRSPTILLELFAGLLGSDVGESIELHFYGNLHDCGPCFERYRELLGTRIFLHGAVDRAIVARVLSEADVLVNIGNQTPYQLPSKVVEYASTGKPILNLVANHEDSSAVFLASYPRAMTLTEADAVSGATVKGLMDFCRRGPVVPRQWLSDWLATFRVDSVARAYERLLGCGS